MGENGPECRIQYHRKKYERRKEISGTPTSRHFRNLCLRTQVKNIDFAISTRRTDNAVLGIQRFEACDFRVDVLNDVKCRSMQEKRIDQTKAVIRRYRCYTICYRLNMIYVCIWWMLDPKGAFIVKCVHFLDLCVCVQKFLTLQGFHNSRRARIIVEHSL